MAEYSESELLRAIKLADERGNVSVVNELAGRLISLRKTNMSREEKLKNAPDMPPYDPTTGEYIPPTYPEQPVDDSNWWDKTKGAVEAATTLGTGMTTGAVSGAVGFGKGLFDAVREGTYGTPQGAKDIQNTTQQFMENLTYTPRTEKGQEYVGEVGELAEYLTPLTGQGQLVANAMPTAKYGLSHLTTRTPDSVPKVAGDRSIAQSQALLEMGGGGLTAYQTGASGTIRNFLESIGEIGLVSRGYFKNLRTKNSEYIASQIKQLINGVDDSLVTTKGEIGKQVFGIINQGKKAAGELLDKDLSAIKAEFGSQQVNVAPVANVLKAYLSSNKTELGYNLDPSTIQVVNSVISRIEGLAPPKPKGLAAFTSQSKNVTPPSSLKASVEAIIDMEKKIGREIDAKGEFGSPSYNSVASRELAQVSKIIKEQILKQYEKEGFPELAEQYKAANSTYSTIVKSLFPSNTENMLKAASKKQNFKSIGNLLINATDVDQINSFMNSIDTAYSTLVKAGKGKGVMKPEEFKAMARQSYLQNLFESSPKDPNELFNSKFIKIYDSLQNPTNRASVKAVLGKDFNTYNALMKALKDASVEQKSSAMSLVIRNQELGGVLGAGLNSVVRSTAALLTPVVLSRFVSSPKAVNNLLKLKNVDLTTPKAKDRALVLINQAIESIEDAEAREEVRKAIKQEQQ